MNTIDKKLYEILGQNLKYYRKKYNYSLEYVGNKIGKTKKTIQRYENGEIKISVEVLIDLCNLYNINSTQLMNEVHDEWKKTFNNLENYDEVDQYGINKREMLELIKDKPELIETYKHITENDNLALLFDAAQGLSPEDLEPVLILINGIRKNKGLE